MAILRKPGKPDYTLLNVHQLVGLLNTMVKVLSACMAEDINHAIETQGLLSNSHFGSRAGWTTTDSLHYITKFVKDAWRRKEVVSVLFLNIKSAFPSVVLDQLVHDMRNRGVPQQYTDWIACKVTGHHTMLKFDGYESEPLPLSKGLDQGCPLSGIAFQFYNSDLVDIKETANGEDAVAYMDDMLLLTRGKTLAESNSKVKNMMTRSRGRLEWSHMHQCKFVIDKFGVMGLTRRREPDMARSSKSRPLQRWPIFLQGTKVPAVAMHKFLLKYYLSYINPISTPTPFNYCLSSLLTHGLFSLLSILSVKVVSYFTLHFSLLFRRLK